MGQIAISRIPTVQKLDGFSLNACNLSYYKIKIILIRISKNVVLDANLQYSSACVFQVDCAGFNNQIINGVCIVKFISLIFAGIFVLSGCSSLPAQTKVSADKNVWQSNQKIGVYVNTVPKITTSFPGAACLLCLAAASVANTSLTKQVETYQAKQLLQTKENVIKILKAKGVEVVVIDSLIKESTMKKVASPRNPHITKNYLIYKEQKDIDQLLVINFTFAGVNRNYAQYIPTSAPQAGINAAFYMIDTKTNDYTLFDPIKIVRGVEGEWDKPPTFPGVTNAFYQAEEAAVDQIAATLK